MGQRADRQPIGGQLPVGHFESAEFRFAILLKRWLLAFCAMSLDDSLEAKDVKEALVEVAIKGRIMGIPNTTPDVLLHLDCVGADV